MQLDRADKFLLIYTPLSIAIILIGGLILGGQQVCCTSGACHLTDTAESGLMMLFLSTILIGLIVYFILKRKITVLLILFFALSLIVAGFTYLFIQGNIRRERQDYPMNITSIIDTDDGNITFSLAGDRLETSDARITITDWQDNVYVNDNLNDSIWNFDNDNCFLWTDDNEDGQIGSGDTIRLYSPVGFNYSNWTINIIQKSRDKIIFNSGDWDIS